MDDTKTKSDKPYRIRAIDAKDAASLNALLCHNEVYPNLLQTPYTPIETTAEMLAKPVPRSLNIVAVIGEMGNETVIASSGLFPASQRLRRAHVRGLGISVLPAWQSKGVGKAMMTAMLDWADNWANVLRIELEVFEDNARAIALYEKFGFIREGQKRCDSFRNGVFASSVLMARLHPRQPMLSV